MIARRLREGRSAVGTMLGLIRSPAIAAIARHAGLDFVMLDMEHRAYSFQTVGDVLSALRREGLGALLRVPEGTRGYISRGLDAGAHGIMVPWTETVQAAQLLAKWAKYPPIGQRGLSTTGAHTDFRSAADVPEHMAGANQETVTIAQIETARAVEAAPDIAAVEGIDALLVGPGDLSVSLGCPNDKASRKMDEAVETIAEAASNAGKVFGIHAGTDLLRRWRHLPIQLLMADTDIRVLSHGFRKIADDLQALHECD